MLLFSILYARRFSPISLYVIIILYALLVFNFLSHSDLYFILNFWSMDSLRQSESHNAWILFFLFSSFFTYWAQHTHVLSSNPAKAIFERKLLSSFFVRVSCLSVVVNVLRCTMRVTGAPLLFIFQLKQRKKKIVEYGASHNKQLTTRVHSIFFWILFSGFENWLWFLLWPVVVVGVAMSVVVVEPMITLRLEKKWMEIEEHKDIYEEKL